MDRSIITVFGGNGFIGRALVRQLADVGYDVRVASRAPEKAAALAAKPGQGSIMPVYASVTDKESVRAALRGADAAINLVSILTEKGHTTFERMNVEAAENVARRASEAKLSRFVHVSAIGAAPDAPSRYGRSKAEGERRVMAAFPGAALLRPSVVFGPGDSFLTLFALMAKCLPALPVYYPQTKLQPVFVEDVARAAFLCLTGEHTGVFELGGPQQVTMEEIMRFVAQTVGRTPRLLSVPNGLAEIQAMLLERLPGKLLTRDQLAMLSQDNIVTSATGSFETLGVVPRSLYDRAPEYLRKISVLRTILK
ncbi:complex I NDUFA9 subunit family protein [Asaia sp. VD9]|uniref:complex I NDUFA9 subunit family protein n=1 Tax=Asaia sp. VD9 TaxID=3081235 RepID=UPI00301AF385